MFALFEEADTDRSGLIDLGEMKQLLAKCEVEMDSGDLKKLFSKYDGDGSGQISFKEFFMMIKELLDVATAFLREGEGKQDEGGESPLGNLGAAPLRMSLAEDMDAAYREAEKLALEAEKKRLQLKQPHGEPTVEASPPDCDVAPKQRPALRRSLWIFSPNNLLRRAAKAFLDYPPRQVENKWFDTLVLLGILASSALLALDNPGIGDDSPERVGLDDAGLALNGLFLLECVCKVLALSFRDYIASGWNKLDFLIVSTSCLDMGLTYGLKGQKINISALKIFRMLRILRALRPLRIIARAKGLRILVRKLPARYMTPVSRACIQITFNLKCSPCILSEVLCFALRRRVGQCQSFLRHTETAPGACFAMRVGYCVLRYPFGVLCTRFSIVSDRVDYCQRNGNDGILAGEHPHVGGQAHRQHSGHCPHRLQHLRYSWHAVPPRPPLLLQRPHHLLQEGLCRC